MSIFLKVGIFMGSSKLDISLLLDIDYIIIDILFIFDCVHTGCILYRGNMTIYISSEI